MPRPFIQGFMTELLRNSEAALAIVQHRHVELAGREEHSATLEAKLGTAESALVEVEGVLAELDQEASTQAGE